MRRPPGGSPTVPIATLDELLEAFPGRPLTIEIKAAAAVGPTPEAFARHRCGDEDIVSSFKERIRSSPAS